MSRDSVPSPLPLPPFPSLRRGSSRGDAGFVHVVPWLCGGQGISSPSTLRGSPRPGSSAGTQRRSCVGKAWCLGLVSPRHSSLGPPLPSSSPTSAWFGSSGTSLSVGSTGFPVSARRWRLHPSPSPPLIRVVPLPDSAVQVRSPESSLPLSLPSLPFSPFPPSAVPPVAPPLPLQATAVWSGWVGGFTGTPAYHVTPAGFCGQSFDLCPSLKQNSQTCALLSLQGVFRPRSLQAPSLPRPHA